MIEISVHGLSDQLQNNNFLINSNNIILDKKLLKLSCKIAIKQQRALGFENLTGSTWQSPSR
jgi:hypothetical protein